MTTSTELWGLPVPASSLLKGPDFTVLPTRRCEISFFVETDDGEVDEIGLLFQGVEAFKCTYLTSCTAEMFNKAYGKLVRLQGTSWLNELLNAYAAREHESYALQHLMICFDDGPCYEVACRSFVLRWPRANVEGV